MVASPQRSRWERRRQSLKIKLMEAGSSIRAVLQGGTDPADVWRAWSPSWWDTPKPRQEPAIPTQTSSLQTCSITSSKANWAENPDPSASCLQELPASLHGCCQHGPGLGQSSICTRESQAKLCWQRERAADTLELLQHNPLGT